MFSITWFIYEAIPVLFVMVAGMLVRKIGQPDAARRRFFLLMAWASIGFLAGMLIANWLMPIWGHSYAMMLAPTMCGVGAAALVHLGDVRALSRADKHRLIVALALLAGFVVIVSGVNWVRQTLPQFLTDSLEPGAVVVAAVGLAGVWRLGRRWPVALILATVAGLALLDGWIMGIPLPAEPPPVLPLWLSWLSVGVYVSIPGLVGASTVLLITIGLERFPFSSKRHLAAWWPMIWPLLTALLLLGYFGYTVVWAGVWDGPDDGIRAFGMAGILGFFTVAIGAMMGLTATDWRRLTGLAFGALVAVVWPSIIGGNLGFNYHVVMDARASRVQQAIEKFHATKGRYPADLKELVPAELWWVSPPVVLYGQDWCYQSGPDFYRLGALYRDYFLAPFHVRIFASAGTVPATSWICDDKLAEVSNTQWGITASGPTPVPLPTSDISVQRIPVQTILRAASLNVGDWSPDGSYLLFGVPELSGGQTVIGLNFLKADTGEICPAGERKWTTGQQSDGMYEQFAWLPDGRALYVAESGELTIFRPCTPGSEDLTSRYPTSFTRAATYNAQSGWVLLKNQSSYWIMDGASLEARQVPSVAPDPQGVSSARYAWAPGGDRLSISRMNGQEAKDGATVYILGAANATLEKILSFNYGPDWPDAPVVEWLTHDEVLVHGGGSLKIMDLRSDPPGVKDLIRDVFLLDAVYPNDFSSEDTVVLPGEGGYYVGVRVNRPQNQAAYVYASKTGRVEVFHPEANILLFLPGGNWMQLPKFESPPTYQEEYEMVWLDQSVETRVLKVEGHVPRSQPQIFPKYLPNSSQLAFGSSQGVSLISVPDGATTKFWQLAGGGGSSNRLYPTLTGKALVIAAQGDGLYYIPLGQ